MTTTLIVLLTILLLMFGFATMATAQVTCQPVGNFTICTYPDGKTITCYKTTSGALICF